MTNTNELETELKKLIEEAANLVSQINTQAIVVKKARSVYRSAFYDFHDELDQLHGLYHQYYSGDDYDDYGMEERRARIHALAKELGLPPVTLPDVSDDADDVYKNY